MCPVSLGRGGIGQGGGLCSWLRTWQGGGWQTSLGRLSGPRLQAGRSSDQPLQDTGDPHLPAPQLNPDSVTHPERTVRPHPPQPEIQTPQTSKCAQTLHRCLSYRGHCETHPPSSAQSSPPPGRLPCFSRHTATGSGGSPQAISRDTASPPFKSFMVPAPSPPAPTPTLSHRYSLQASAHGSPLPVSVLLPHTHSGSLVKAQLKGHHFHDDPLTTLRSSEIRRSQIAGARLIRAWPGTGAASPIPHPLAAPPPGRRQEGQGRSGPKRHWGLERPAEPATRRVTRTAPSRRQGYGQLPGRDRYCAGDRAGRRLRGSSKLSAKTPGCPRAAAPGGETLPPSWSPLAAGQPLSSPAAGSPRPGPARNLLLRLGSCSALGA